MNRLPEGWNELDDLAKKSVFVQLYSEVQPIRNRCHNVTQPEMLLIHQLVAVIHHYFPQAIRKVSACQIPHITARAAQILHGMGLKSNPHGTPI
jgi:hypothetical protein